MILIIMRLRCCILLFVILTPWQATAEVHLREPEYFQVALEQATDYYLYQPRPDIRIKVNGFSLTDAQKKFLDDGTAKLYAAMMWDFKLSYTQAPTITGWFFKDEAVYRSYIARVGDKNIPKSASGYYTSDRNEVIVCAESYATLFKQPLTTKGSNILTDDAFDFMARIYFHELAHLLMNAYSQHFSRWFGEGSAKFFEGITPEGDAVKLLPSPHRVAAMVTYAKEDKIKPLKSYMPEDLVWVAQMRKDENLGINYEVIGSLLQFMMRSEDGHRTVKALMKYYRLREGEHSTAEAIRIINHGYPGGFDKLEADWRGWLKGGAEKR